MFQQKAWKMNFSNNIVYMKQNKINIERLKFFNNLGKLKRFNERKSLVVMLICFNGWFDPNNDDPHSSSAVVIIISQNSSKSMVPLPSSSISAMMPSRSSSVRLGSTSATIDLNWAIVMKPVPCLSNSRNACFSSALIVSGSGSSTRNLAHSWANSGNSMAPLPSSSISSISSASSSGVGRKPMALITSSMSSASRKSCFLVSNSWKQLKRTLMSSISRQVASIISSKSTSAHGSLLPAIFSCAAVESNSLT